MKSIYKICNRRFFLKIAPWIFLIATVILAKPQPLNPALVRDFSLVSKAESVPGEVLVQYKNHVRQTTAVFHTHSRGNRLVRSLRQTAQNVGPTHLVEVRPESSVAQAITEYSQNSDIEFAQPNYIYHVTTTDTSYGQLWGLNNSAQTVTGATYATNNPGTAGKDINAAGAWGVITACSSVVVAVVDSGINYNHEDLSANMVNGSYSCPGGTGTKGCDFVKAGSNNPMDLNGHGTHVAGIIGASGNNALGTTGVCQTAKILAVRVLDASGSGSTADIIEGVNFAAGAAAGQGNAKIINMSLGGSGYDPLFYSAITNAQSSGVVVVVAAGNSGLDHSIPANKFYPCDYTQSNIICVAAVDQNYAIASFSDFDANATVANRNVDVGAPGTNILSAFAGAATIASDTLNAWTLSSLGGSLWGHSVCGLNDMLLLPNNCSTVLNSTGSYAANTDSTAYKSFAISATADGVWINSYLTMNLESGYDLFYANYTNTPGNPMAGTSLFAPYTAATGSTGGIIRWSSALDNCVGSTTCSIGFRVTSNNSINLTGVGIQSFSIATLDKDILNAYAIENGTSMASPYVAGIATMVRARNPNFTADDTVNAILSGGDLEASMTGKTKSGMVADAFGALKYIPATEGITLTSP
jgi:subtilisin family serine protease